MPRALNSGPEVLGYSCFAERAPFGRGSVDAGGHSLDRASCSAPVTDRKQRFGGFTPTHLVEELRAARRVPFAASRRRGAECGKVRRGTVDRGLWGRRVGLTELMAARIAACDPIIAVDPLLDLLLLAREFGTTREDVRRDLGQLVMDEVEMEGVVIDTNVFVTAGFDAKSASARILAAIRERWLQLVWNKPTRASCAEFGPSIGISAPISFAQRES